MILDDSREHWSSLGESQTSSSKDSGFCLFNRFSKNCFALVLFRTSINLKSTSTRASCELTELTGNGASVEESWYKSFSLAQKTIGTDSVKYDSCFSRMFGFSILQQYFWRRNSSDLKRNAPGASRSSGHIKNM